MDFQPFREQCETLSDYDRKTVGKLCDRIDQVFGDSEELFNNDEAIRALLLSKSGKTSKASFFAYKKVAVLFYQWLYDNGKISEDTLIKVKNVRYNQAVLDSVIAEYYFESLDSALGFIDVVGSANGTFPNDLLDVKTLVILLWHDVSPEDIVGIKKIDVLSPAASKSIQIRNADGTRDVTIDPKYINILRLFAQLSYKRNYIANSYTESRDNQYVPSAYLMRSNTRDSWEVSNVYNCIYRFNTVARSFGKTLDAACLRRNGKCWKVYEDVKKTGELSKSLKQVLRLNPQRTYEFKAIYLSWEKYYISQT